MPSIPLPNWYIAPYHSKFPQATGFNKGFIAFGDNFASYTTTNRSLSFATYTETTHTAMSTAARIHAMPCASPSHLYHMAGYAASGYVSTVNKLTSNTSTESTVTISWSTTRRGGSHPGAHLNRNRMYFFGGYSDSLSQYMATISFVTQNTDTETSSGAALGAGRHLSTTLFNTVQAHIVAGYASGGGTTNTNYKYTYATDAITTVTGDTINTGIACGFSSNVAGYRVQGYNIQHTQNTKYTFSSDTWATATNSPETNGMAFGCAQYVNQYEGALWCGYNSVFAKRLLYRLAWANETYTNSSYTTGDPNNGFLFYVGGY